MPSDISIAAAGRLLRSLAKSSPTDAGQLDAWYDRADEFQLLLKEHSALSELIPHFCMALLGRRGYSCSGS
jgi:hypothetical protein